MARGESVFERYIKEYEFSMAKSDMAFAMEKLFRRIREDIAFSIAMSV